VGKYLMPSVDLLCEKLLKFMLVFLCFVIEFVFGVYMHEKYIGEKI